MNRATRPTQSYERSGRKKLYIRRVLDGDAVRHRHTGGRLADDLRLGIQRRERVAQELFSSHSFVDVDCGGLVCVIGSGGRVAGRRAGHSKVYLGPTTS